MSDEEIAAQAAEEAIAETDEQRDGKRKERLEQHRISARESRKRKKSMIEGEFPHCSVCACCLFVPRLLGFVTEGEDGACPLASDIDRILLKFCCIRASADVSMHCCNVIGPRILHPAFPHPPSPIAQ